MESKSVDVSLTVRGSGRQAGIGERLPSLEAPVDITAEVTGVPSGVVRLITDEGQLLQSQLPASGAGSVTWRTTPRQSAYVRLEVRHPLADGTAGNGSAVSATPALGSMAR